MAGRWIGMLALLCACGGDDDPHNGSGVPGTSGATNMPTMSGETSGPSGATSNASDSVDPATSAGPTDDSTATGSSQTDTTVETDETGDPGPRTLPPANGGLDYQLGGAYDPPSGVEVLSRDRNDPPAAGLYNICYVNGYQTQPDEEQWWLDNHPDLLLRDGDGDPVIDPDWDEILLDITTDEKRQALAEIVGGWIEQCGEDGFNAVEIDNLDTYSRSDGMISQDDAVDYMSLLSASAHAAGLAIAQKNSVEIADRQAEMGTDFAVAEECNRWNECQDYKAVYDDHVFVIEYRQQDFDAGCDDFPELSIVLRDLDLVPEGSGAYVYDACRGSPWKPARAECVDPSLRGGDGHGSGTSARLLGWVYPAQTLCASTRIGGGTSWRGSRPGLSRRGAESRRSTRRSTCPRSCGNTCVGSIRIGRTTGNGTQTSPTTANWRSACATSRMSSSLDETLASLARAFSAAGVDWYLFGAQAALLRGGRRMTADVDVTVVTRVDTKRLLVELEKEDLRPRFDLDEEFIVQTTVLPVEHASKIACRRRPGRPGSRRVLL